MEYTEKTYIESNGLLALGLTMAAIPEETLEYWKERVAGAASLQLPSDYPTPDNAQVMYRAIIEGATFLVTIWKMWCCHSPPKKKRRQKLQVDDDDIV